MAAPASVVKYALGIRELAMQTSFRNPKDMTAAPPPTNKTSKVLDCDRESLPQIKLGFGPVGWDQVWSHNKIKLSSVSNHADDIDFWNDQCSLFLRLCCLEKVVDFYAFEVKFPLGFEPNIDDPSLRVPPGGWALVSPGEALQEWFIQIVYHRAAYPSMYTKLEGSSATEPEPITISMRFTNNNSNDGTFTKSSLSDEELSLLSRPSGSAYTDSATQHYIQTFLNGGTTTPINLTTLQHYFTSAQATLPIAQEHATNPRCYTVPFYLRKQDYGAVLDWMEQQNILQGQTIRQGRKRVAIPAAMRRQVISQQLDMIWQDIMAEVVNAGVHPSKRTAWIQLDT